jgi:capsular exopolysaccharide synthesis family protein
MTGIELAGGGQLIRIKASASYPELSARIANSMAEIIEQENRGQKLSQKRASAMQAEAQFDAAKRALAEAENSLARFKDKHSFVSGEEQHNLVLEELTKLIQMAAEAGAARIEKEAMYSYLKQLPVEDLRRNEGVGGDELIRSLRMEQLKSVLEVGSSEGVPGGRNPPAEPPSAGAAGIEEAIDREVLRVVEEVRQAQEEAKHVHNTLVSAVAEKKREVFGLERALGAYRVLCGTVEVARKTHADASARVQKSEFWGRPEPPDLRIVANAEAPKKPVRRRTLLNAILGLVIGTGLGAVSAMALKSRWSTIEHPAEVKFLLGRPVLGTVPFIPYTYGHGAARGTIAHRAPNSPIAEDYKSILASLDDSFRAILVTSAGPREGKTVTLVNVGISAATMGKRVLIVDSDMRKPAIHVILGLPEGEGLTDYLMGNAELQQVIRQSPIENVSVVSRGTPVENTFRLATSERMKEFVQRAKHSFDLVLLDSPPCTVVADALPLAKVTDGVINVIRSGQYSKDRIARAIELLDRVKANVIGVILNAAKGEGFRQYSSHYSYPVRRFRRSKGAP